MKLKIIHFFLVFSVLGVLTSAGQSQYLWHITHTDNDGQYLYAFDAISCSGNNCSVGGSLINPIQPLVTRMFWHSIDGGISWKIQNPGLASYTDLKHKHYFSAIQQIDSLNVIAGGDSGYVVRTFDGGNTWERQNLKTSGVIRAIHFSDPLTGIILSQENYQVIIGGGKVVINTTTDGGKNWMKASLNEFNPNAAGNIVSCHSYGNGKFRTFKSYKGTVYSTYDNWQTVDSTSFLLNHTQEDSIYYAFSFYHCNFSNGDTIITYGNYYDTANLVKHGSLTMSSTDAGRSWGAPVRIPTSTGVLNMLSTMTSIDRDTLLANAPGSNKFLMSTDRGISWRVDSLILDTNFAISSSNGIAITGDGHPLAVFGNGNASYGIPMIILRGENMKNHVDQIDLPAFKPHVYPNPASDFLNLISLDASRPIYIIDIFGREHLRSVTSDQGKAIVNISSLPSGIYNVLIDRNGKKLKAGKVVVNR